MAHSTRSNPSTLLGIGLHDLQDGLLSRTLRLQVVICSSTSGSHISKRQFHTSKQRKGWPLLATIIGGLKSSTALGVLGTVVRVSMTFIPALLIKSRFITKYIAKIDKYFPDWQDKRKTLLKHLKFNKIAFRVLIALPMLLLALTMFASIERAPMTGRWRLILISPNEEAEIVKSLTGSWRAAIDDILAATLESGIPPPALPPTDWRYRWVEDTLRRLEAAVPLLQVQQGNGDVLKMMDAKKYPFPPPCAYPLAPRPRPARVLHSWAEQAHPLDDPEAQAQHLDVLPQAMIGPPYSCLVVERPDSQNAFSYGFGPNGAGGIVVYTGFLDQVLNHPRTPQNVEPTPLPSWWSMIFGSLISSPRRQQAFTPSEEQTAELAVLLAHELAHLLLSHHLETLSSGTILYPSVMSIFTDVARTILFPITMLLGPFVNDALGQMGRKHSARFERLGEMCSARKLEIEADIVSARLLAFAGIDPREAVRFWEHRVEADPLSVTGPNGQTVECAVSGKTQEGASWAMGHEVHPLNEERIRRLKSELEGWGASWRKFLIKDPASGRELETDIDELERLFKT